MRLFPCTGQLSFLVMILRIVPQNECYDYVATGIIYAKYMTRRSGYNDCKV